MKEFISVGKSLPEVKKVDDDYNESKLVVCLTRGNHEHIAKLNTGISEGLEWEVWYCPNYEDTLEEVTHWCDCIPEIPTVEQ